MVHALKAKELEDESSDDSLTDGENDEHIMSGVARGLMMGVVMFATL